MSKSLAIIIGLILLAALLLFSMTYTVKYHEVAIKTRFGKVNDQSVVDEPGLKFRLPLFADRVTTFDTRLQLRESPHETVQTADGRQVVVKAFLMWKVREDGDGPVKFFESYSSVEEANASLANQFTTAMRSGLSRFSFDDLIGAQGRLSDAETAIRDELMSVRAKGIEPVTVGVSHLALPPRTAQRVLTRMQETQKLASDLEQNKGREKATAIQNRAGADAEKIKSFAQYVAAEIRATGEQSAAQYYTQMGGEAEELAIFLQWLDGLRSSLSQYTTVILPANFEPFHLWNTRSPPDRNGIPQPPSPASTQPGVAGVEKPPAAGIGMKTPDSQEPADG